MFYVLMVKKLNFILLPPAGATEIKASSYFAGTMSGPRSHTIMGLLLLMCALTEHVCESAPSTVPVVRGDARPDLRRMQHIMRHVEDNRGRHHSAKTEAPGLTESSYAEQRDFRNKADKGNQSVGECCKCLLKNPHKVHLEWCSKPTDLLHSCNLLMFAFNIWYLHSFRHNAKALTVLLDCLHVAS